MLHFFFIFNLSYLSFFKYISYIAALFNHNNHFICFFFYCVTTSIHIIICSCINIPVIFDYIHFHSTTFPNYLLKHFLISNAHNHTLYHVPSVLLLYIWHKNNHEYWFFHNHEKTIPDLASNNNT